MERKGTRRGEKQISDYETSIRDVTDLVRFCFAHDISGSEYCDYEALAAAKTKAAELLGITKKI